MYAQQVTPAPERLGEFDVEHELGRGGSGVVYAARHGATEVALKVLREDEVATPKERERFLGEARHLAKLAHPGIVRVIAVGVLPDGRPYLAMERLRGTTLAERTMMRRFAPDQALVLFEQLAAAVAALHAAGLVHRDIKPENVMLVDGERRVVLLDLGIARGIDDVPSTTTQAGLQRGTPAYMAPERFFGARATVSSDVYETAVVLYVMLTGQLPWRDPRSPKERMEPRTPASLGVALAPGLEAALMGALVADVDERPATIEALVARVRAAGWEGETTAGPPPATEKQRSSSVLPVIGMAAAFVAAAVVAVIAMRKDEPAREAAPPPIATVASPVITPIAAPDAGVVAVDAERVAVVDPIPTPQPKPKSPPKPKPPKPKAATTKSGTGSCHRLAELYCTDEFQATEGKLAGKLCEVMRKNADDFAKLPPPADAEQEQWCRDNHDTMAAAVEERLRHFAAGIHP